MNDDSTSQNSTGTPLTQPPRSNSQDLYPTIENQSMPQMETHSEDSNVHYLSRLQDDITLLRKDLTTLMEKMQIASNSRETMPESRKWYLFTNDLPLDSTYASIESLLRTFQLVPTSISIISKNGQPIAFIDTICSSEQIRSLLQPSKESKLPRFQLARRPPWRKAGSDPHKSIEDHHLMYREDALWAPKPLPSSRKIHHTVIPEHSIQYDPTPGNRPDVTESLEEPLTKSKHVDSNTGDFRIHAGYQRLLQKGLSIVNTQSNTLNQCISTLKHLTN